MYTFDVQLKLFTDANEMVQSARAHSSPRSPTITVQQPTLLFGHFVRKIQSVHICMSATGGNIMHPAWMNESEKSMQEKKLHSSSNIATVKRDQMQYSSSINNVKSSSQELSELFTQLTG